MYLYWSSHLSRFYVSCRRSYPSSFIIYLQWGKWQLIFYVLIYLPGFIQSDFCGVFFLFFFWSLNEKKLAHGDMGMLL